MTRITVGIRIGKGRDLAQAKGLQLGSGFIHGKSSVRHQGLPRGRTHSPNLGELNNLTKEIRLKTKTRNHLPPGDWLKYKGCYSFCNWGSSWKHEGRLPRGGKF
jgi:hypothetical protein